MSRFPSQQRNFLGFLVALMLLWCAIPQSLSGQDAPIVENSAPPVGEFQEDGIGGSAADAGLAIVRPDEYAWQLFAQLSQPSGLGDGTVVWENWALARLVYSNPDITPDWDTCRTPSSDSKEDRFESLPIQQKILRAAHESATGHAATRRQSQPGANPVGFDPNLAGLGGGDPENDEVRMNHSAFQTIVDNELFNVDGQEKAFETGAPIAFQPDAKEIKAEWKNITSTPETHENFHTATFDVDGKRQVWGLVALHITTKDLPNWFWATWEHDSVRQRESVVPMRDRWGAKLRRKVGKDQSGEPVYRNVDVTTLLTGTEKGDPYPDGSWVAHSTELQALLDQKGLTAEKWKHYVLRGTQVDFVDKHGRPTILANSVIEEGFTDTSSCITCHAKAGIGPRMRRSDEKNMLPVFASTDPPVGDIGNPKTEWFFGATTIPSSRKYLQFDFVWSTIRAKRKTNGIAVGAQSKDAHPLVGRWTYRALMNDAAEVTDAQISQVTLGTGVIEILSVVGNQFQAEMTINESTTPGKPWKLEAKGTCDLVDHKWSLEFEGKGTSPENDANSNNFWHYEYEGSSFKSGMKFTDASGGNGRVPVLAGRVSRVQKHATGPAAKRLRENPSLTVKDLDPATDFYPAGFSGTFQMVKQ